MTNPKEKFRLEHELAEIDNELDTFYRRRNVHLNYPAATETKPEKTEDRTERTRLFIGLALVLLVMGSLVLFASTTLLQTTIASNIIAVFVALGAAVAFFLLGTEATVNGIVPVSGENQYKFTMGGAGATFIIFLAILVPVLKPTNAGGEHIEIDPVEPGNSPHVGAIYKLQPIGLSPNSECEVFDINDSGTVAGWTFDQQSKRRRAFILSSDNPLLYIDELEADDATLTDFTKTKAGPATEARSISNAQNVVGVHEDWFEVKSENTNLGITAKPEPRPRRRGFYWDSSVKAGELHPLKEGYSTRPFRISKNGSYVVGTADVDKGGDGHAFILLANQPNNNARDLSEAVRAIGLPARYSNAYGVNNDGVVVGDSHEADFSIDFAVVWRPINLQSLDFVAEDLGSLGGQFSTATAINDRGNVVGNSQDGTGVGHAFFWRDHTTGLQKLPALIEDGNMPENRRMSGAEDITNGEIICGWSIGKNPSGDLESHAVVWNDGKILDLNQAVANLENGIVLAKAVAINENGAIAVNAFDSQRKKRAFILIRTKQ